MAAQTFPKRWRLCSEAGRGDGVGGRARRGLRACAPAVFPHLLRSSLLHCPALLSRRPQRRILITGGAGFVGSNLVDALMRQGHIVYCLDNLFTGKVRPSRARARAAQTPRADAAWMSDAGPARAAAAAAAILAHSPDLFRSPSPRAAEKH